ncbi:MAG: TlpA family protein disulfide reductase [Bacteroidetes bacterium]|jgi:cytochrome c biogenesis protein CcmG, thiol:disulfide interchange protein DsbE|nr:TlpA family protein disulfide reductase [Bacteroidota bacterium]MBT3750869.1 TlpA family protein disulfide reductase [Bacteroidota bacterium]MBT4398110.1 TlpA family protein disulfide reductase [Bacteroidota bacterium]MBT4411362.1 TlpA family protein disulfide reductase [Bacteroidota bacterium]MBT5426530.1 TlpA family protein disulfide reductase [Bacteroidota bacterium]
MQTKLIPFLAIFIAVACQPKADFITENIPIQNLPDAAHVVAAGDLTSSKYDELVIGTDSAVQVFSIVDDTAQLLLSKDFNDAVLLIEIGDVDNDGANEMVLVTGQMRYQKTDVSVYVIEESDEWVSNKVYAKFSTRPHATNLLICDADNDGKNEIMVSYFESKYIVETAVIRKQGREWTGEIVEQRRMAMVRDVGKLPAYKGSQSVVGRVYGDEIGISGDAYIFDDQNTMLPAKRGVKCLKIADGNNDGENDILIGDGWHQDYGKIARARIAIIHVDGELFEYELIEDVKYQYEISQIEVADVDRDGLNEVLSRGNMFFRIYKSAGDSWQVFKDTAISNSQFVLGNITGDKRPEVIFSGKEIQIYNFGNLEYSDELDKEVVTEKVLPDSLIGERAPELSVLEWFNGQFAGLYNSKGKVIMLDFWATWCAPCKKTFPDLKRLQNKYGDQGFQILGLTKIDRSQSQADIKDFVNQQDFAYPIGLSDESLNKLAYGVGAIPHVVLIDKAGIVRWYKIGAGDPASLEKEIQKLLME